MTEIDVPVPGDKGVRYVAPPEQIIPNISANIRKAVESIGGDGNAALVAVADRKGGWNTAFVLATGDRKDVWSNVSVETWIGKEWGTNQELDWGVRVLKTWTLGGTAKR